ncbi:MAG: hypothetical protein GC154_09125 [bacterium]|nr:hypothetical protein [bacterium]
MTTRRIDAGLMILIGLAALKLALHLYVNIALPEPYGIFRDELYYIACSERLDFGYVDHPPLCAVTLAASRTVLGDSLPALRFLPGLFGAGVVVLAGLLARELGGGTRAMALAGAAALAMPVAMAVDNFYSMNAFDHLAWMTAAYLLARLIRRPSLGLWIALGAALGLGLQNKISVLFFGFGLTAGLALTPLRKWFADWRLYLAGAIALAIFTPHIVWQIAHGWPTLEFIHNAKTYKNLPMTPAAFFIQTSLEANPVSLPLWLMGLWFFMFSRAGRDFRVFGWIFVIVTGVFLMQNAKTYYLAPAMPILMSGGAVWLESVCATRWARAIPPGYAALTLICGALLAPLALPILPPQAFLAYAKAAGVQSQPGERGDFGELPQVFADMIGWKQMAEELGKAYQSLSPEERERCAIVLDNYGQAGAVEFYGKPYGLPTPICGHNNYYFWAPENPPWDIIITLGAREDAEGKVESIEEAGVFTIRYSREFHNPCPVLILRDPKITYQEALQGLKHFI